MTEQTGPTSPTDADKLAGLRTELAGLQTEATAEGLDNLDILGTEELVAAMLAHSSGVHAAVQAASPAIVQTVDAVAERLQRGGRLLYVGAGTAGRLGVLDASECPPTFGTPPGLVVGLIAGGVQAIQKPVEYAEDNATAGARDLHDINVTEADAVVGITASGRTPYVIGALEEARKRGAFTASLACNKGSAVSHVADAAIEVEVGPEFIAGSTRLNSGTAQKLVLNMISTLVMVKLGKTYGNLMVDLRATNEKLLARSQRTVQHATGVSAQEAATALDSVGGSVKAAILVLLTGIDAGQAKSALEEAGGFLRRAIENQK
ncbi:N-acetylmuramic acid 6-phosphate etherase [Paenarthrobacter nitroguajacolicus]|uniref:N-acetylmuramic acid 6-phosphate etherase n=1 Tax=Paenarthrobacter nitroguajacolicus TaxID=211146 RepID=A0A558HC66_PAENT|nr:N-acetylmuramic acid 6-phosphate etherase [Paenarthrobacter nitroguajacolicus]TVU66726.1 N-acetylmuramic acid 6-phosphate etherase [Paenarthrobacter nitroguajacolicus]